MACAVYGLELMYADLSLTVFHTNDCHAHFEPIINFTVAAAQNKTVPENVLEA